MKRVGSRSQIAVSVLVFRIEYLYFRKRVLVGRVVVYSQQRRFSPARF